ncbi:glycosyl transferase family 90 [Phyllobacterium sp. K27]
MSITRAIKKIEYYSENVIRDLLPQYLFRRKLNVLCEDFQTCEADYLRYRLNYYNKIGERSPCIKASSRISNLPRNQSMYYYDLKEHARYFPCQLRISPVFGDVTFVPPVASIVKSRPIRGDNKESVLLKLNKLRHFQKLNVPVTFAEKQPLAVWRGGNNNEKRFSLVKRYINHPLCNVGITNNDTSDPLCKPFMSAAEQIRQFRYIISVEGHDVATNLQWIMASQSLCMMPEPVYETWFMEGRLIPGHHYVQLRPDFADLEDKIRYYNKHVDEAVAIIRNANAHVSQFNDQTREKLLSLLVLCKYFAMSGQWEPTPKVATLWD